MSYIFAGIAVGLGIAGVALYCAYRVIKAPWG